MVFEKLIGVLEFGCACWRIADEECSATTLGRRRDEWIETGAMDALREMVLGGHDRLIGLELSDVVVDCCITKAPCGGEKVGRSPVDENGTAGFGSFPTPVLGLQCQGSLTGCTILAGS